MVESVAWIAERKNVLSLVLCLAALLVYGRFARLWGPQESSERPADSARGFRRGRYAIALVLFAAALLSKTTVCTLPAVILLLCWWKRGCLRWRADVLPTLPFFALAALLGALVVGLEKHSVGAEGPHWDVTFGGRCIIAGRALWFYAGKLFWPADLCFVYPHWRSDPASPAEWLWPVGAGGVLLVLWLARRRIGRGPATAAFFFAGTLFPLLGFMNSYFMRYSFVCDHWVYFPSLGLIALTAAAGACAAAHWRAPAAFSGVAAMVLGILGSLTWHQSRMYADSETLWRTTLERNPASDLAHTSLGAILLEKGDLDGAFTAFRSSLEIQPNNPEALNNLGGVFLKTGRADETITCLRKAIEVDPGYPMSYANLGFLLVQMGRVDEGITNLLKAIELHPDYADAHNNLGNAYLQQGRFAEAVAQYQTAAQLQPDKPYVLNNLAWVWVTCPDASIRNGIKALELAQQANRLAGGKDSRVLTTLAAAYAEVGRFSEAAATAGKALDLSVAQNNAFQAELLRGHLKQYRAGVPLCGKAK
jgi:Flp pilus assembly protein TadD